MVSRETVFAAVFALIRNAPGFTLTSRTLKHWDNVPPSSQPACFQAEGRQTADAHYRLPTKWTFDAEWVVYAHASNAGNTTGDVVTLLNTLVDALVVAIAPDYEGEQTLGGLVTDCRISGEIETSEGRLGEQAVATIPLIIIVNA